MKNIKEIDNMRKIKTVEERIAAKYKRENRVARLNREDIEGFAEYAFNCNTLEYSDTNAKLRELLYDGFSFYEKKYFWKVYNNLVDKDMGSVVDNILNLVVEDSTELEGFYLEDVITDYLTLQIEGCYSTSLIDFLVDRLTDSIIATIEEEGFDTCCFETELLKKYFQSPFGCNYLDYLVRNSDKLSEIIKSLRD